MKIPLTLTLPLAGVLTVLSSSAKAQETTETAAPQEHPFVEALKNGETWVNLRYRFEFVDQDGIPNNAYSSTLRTVLGYRTGSYKGFSGLLEFFNVSSIGNESYRSTDNNVVDRPVVADPTGSQINRAQLEWAADEKNSLIAGRQRINLDNQRFVGAVDWRQNQQTFDSFSYSGKDLAGFDLFYAYLDNTNTVLRTNQPMSSHLANAKYGFGNLGALTGYIYALDFANATANNLSTNTYGAYFKGKPALNDNWTIDYRAEYAYQADTGSNPNNVGADYMHFVLGGDFRRTRLGIGYEVLGGTGTLGEAFQTPLATAHAFNGWADQFLVTPAGGLKDLYIDLGHKLDRTSFLARYHDFQPDSSGADYGTEIDLLATHKVNSDLRLGFKFAYYDADSFKADTTKAWLWIGYNF